ncbi:endolytic transglycosylase MltG [Flavobacterium sp. JP2137]|uniref:endolytic transglycosylase MltG n=1 Tax=Flavobacterium sp. JP2137 TaxID=3414510 RepID=UPI003D2FED32
MNLKKAVSVIAVVALLGAMVYAYTMYDKAFSTNIKGIDKETYIYIPSKVSYADVQRIIAPYVVDMDKFEAIAEQFKYSSNIISGKFLWKKGMNSYDMMQALRKNIPVKVTFNNQETIERLVQRLATQIEPDSLSLLETFTDPTFMEENGFTNETVLASFMPNTYEFYWNVSPLKVRNTMHKEYIKFWNEARLEKAKKLDMTPVEVAVLAAIVQKETAKNDEKARVAGAYLNRLRLGMLLQADPTVVFAKKKYTNDFDQVIKRVYLKDLGIPSPYNTYQNVGLPPGLIAMPDISSLEAVLDPEQHDYIYFCASVEKMGYHEFAATLAQHNINRKKYTDWLTRNGIE